MLLEPPDYTFQLPEFEGPLDVLLRLIEREELDITAIALAQVADQYLAHVRAMSSPDPAAMSAFLVLAARLLLIKSRALVARPPAQRATPGGDEQDDAETLARQLREYQRYKQAASLLGAWQAQGHRSYQRTAPPPLPDIPPPRLEATLDELIRAVQRRLSLQQTQQMPIVAVPVPKQVTVQEMAERIRGRLRTQEWVDFRDVLSLATGREEVVVALWAVLEMFKRQALVVQQAELFGPIMIGRGTALETLRMPWETQEFD